jgi:hypothetical protein
MSWRNHRFARAWLTFKEGQPHERKPAVEFWPTKPKSGPEKAAHHRVGSVLPATAIRLLRPAWGADPTTLYGPAERAWDAAASYIQHLHGDGLAWFAIAVALALALALLAPAFNNWWNEEQGRCERQYAVRSPLAAVSAAIGQAADDPACASELLEELAAVTAVIEASTPRLRQRATPGPPASPV